MSLRELWVDPEDQLVTALDCLAFSHFGCPRIRSRRHAKSLVADGMLRVNGEKVTESFPCKPGDTLTLEYSPLVEKTELTVRSIQFEDTNTNGQHKPIRLETFARRVFHEQLGSRGAVKRACKSGQVFVNGIPAESSRVLKDGDGKLAISLSLIVTFNPFIQLRRGDIETHRIRRNKAAVSQ
jgi:ribosomal 50S subunit-recycling heat shock protein